MKIIIIDFVILFCMLYFNDAFSPSEYDYNAYGLKMAMNEFLFVKVQNEYNPPLFLIQFSPDHNTSLSSSYTISFPNTIDHYIYTVAVSQNSTEFFFAGELINEQNGTFIGMAKYNNNNSLTSDRSFSFYLQYFYNYEHEDYYVIGVESQGRFVYGFANKFIYIFDSQTHSIVNLWNGNLTWPDNSFMPHAVAITDSFGIIAGFIRNPNQTITIYIPIIYLINFNSSNYSLIIVHAYQPPTNPGTWQDLLTNSDANSYLAKYDMSIDINKNGKILVGMQFINRVFLLSVNLIRPNRLNFISRNTNGRSIGNGKGVAWLDNGIAAVLVNTYSLNYQWSSSQIYFYDIQHKDYNTNSTPFSVFPNNHQLLPLSFSSILLNIISSSSSLALIDDEGHILILSPTLPGFYPMVNDSGSIPVFTSPQPCLPGTYKNQMGVYDCLLCPTGTRNPGNSSLQCLSCLPNSFCSLGAVSDIPQTVLDTTIQIRSYPKSLENTVFDDILIENMFSMGTGHCLVVSPLFWTLIVGSLAIVMIILMGILKNCINHSRSENLRRRLKYFFQHLDLINEGELWIGGLVSFSVTVMISFAYSFSSQFLNQYPLEQTSNSSFACDLSLRNAKFQTDIRPLTIPVTGLEQNMFDLLNHQIFYLNVDFINTFINCDAIFLQALYGGKWNVIRWKNCANMNSILSLCIALPYQFISVQILLDDIRTIGALRIGLSGHGDESEHLNLRELNFHQSFFKLGQILAQNLAVILDVTKVLNETLPMTGEESDFSGIYIPTFTMDTSSLFLSVDQYIRLTSMLTTFQIDIHETPYYVKNVQQPIAKRSEIIFHNLLFTIVCLDIFGFGFLFYKLIFKPLAHLLFPQHFKRKKKKKKSMKMMMKISTI